MSWMLEEFEREDVIANACNLQTFRQRMVASGLGAVLDSSTTPRKRCIALRSTGLEEANLLTENAQRSMIRAIDRSLSTYVSGIRCWAAFNDAMGVQIHFPATEDLVLKYASVFANHDTMLQYLKHLRWAHRFLRMPCSWDTPSVRQAVRGLRKNMTAPRPKVALTSETVLKLIRLAEMQGEQEVAALMAISRLFLLRVPSEGVPLEWDGQHSKVTVSGDTATILLTRRKNSAVPTEMVRQCCCSSSTRRMCAVHWIGRIREHVSESGRMFSLSSREFLSTVRRLALELGVPHHAQIGTHAFRRGMAQDIIDAGGSLSVLLRAGQWNSNAFLRYLREAQPQEAAVAQTVINLSDSEDEFES